MKGCNLGEQPIALYLFVVLGWCAPHHPIFIYNIFALTSSILLKASS
jgi:hypothetical protein